MGLVAIGALVFIFRPASIMLYIKPVTGWCVLGMVLNAVCIAVMFIFVFNSVFAENTAALVIKAASRVFKIRNGGKYMDRLAKAMERYKDSANYFASHKFVIWNVP